MGRAMWAISASHLKESTRSRRRVSFRTALSQAGFDGGSEARMMSWQRGILPTDGQTEEVPRRADSARYPARVGEQAADRSYHGGSRDAPLDVAQEGQPARGRLGQSADLPSSQEREEIRRLRAENVELRRANEILKSASVFFAKELDEDRTR